MERLDINRVGGITNIQTAGIGQRDVNVLFRASPIGGQGSTMIRSLRIAMQTLKKAGTIMLKREIALRGVVDYNAFLKMLQIIDPPLLISKFISFVKGFYRAHIRTVLKIALGLRVLQRKIAALSGPNAAEDVEDWTKAQLAANFIRKCFNH